VTTTASLDYYTEIIHKKATLRALIEAGGRISEFGYDEASETAEILDKAETMIFDISRNEGSGNYYLINEFLYDHIDTLEELHRDPNRHTITGFSTGFPRFDEMTSGLQRSDLIVIAGRPGTGKTSLALAMSRHIAIRENAAVGIFSLEMTKEQMLERLLCGEAKVSLHRLRGGYVPAAKWRDIANAASKFQKARIMVDDSPGTSVLEIRAKARRMMAQHGLDMLIVDYLQLLEGSIRTDVREQEIAHITRSLKKLARELNVPVIAISQLNRAVEQREKGKKYPRLSDMLTLSPSFTVPTTITSRPTRQRTARVRGAKRRSLSPNRGTVPWAKCRSSSTRPTPASTQPHAMIQRHSRGVADGAMPTYNRDHKLRVREERWVTRRSTATLKNMSGSS